MNIEEYFAETKTLLDQFARASFVALPSLEHKHESARVISIQAPDLIQVLREIAQMRKWA